MGMMMGYVVGLMPVVSTFLILFGIPDVQTKMSVSKKCSYVISIENLCDRAANLHCALLPLVTHYNGMVPHCKQGLEWLVC